ncbi:MAG: hypothetical protein LBI04_00430 [Treponema sp.]|jgi:hypothetical protein|nr:hypothetical protein [Treponema sp.]
MKRTKLVYFIWLAKVNCPTTAETVSDYIAEKMASKFWRYELYEGETGQ